MPNTMPDIDRPAAKSGTGKIRNVRVEDQLWSAASERAKRDGMTISEVVRHYLAEYARD